MTFEQIGYFLALAEEGSFVGAARRCGISQPSLSNAIKSLEAVLGMPLFKRTAKGAELTAFGRKMHPLLSGLHHDRHRALQFARAFNRSSNGRSVARHGLPRRQSRLGQAARIARLSRRRGALALVTLFVCATIVISGPASAGENDVEIAVRETLPAPFRCSRTTEPALDCRHDNAADHTMVLELASGPDGPSATLAHDYDDAGRHQLFAIVRGFFIRLGVPADAFDERVAQAQWQPRRQPANGRHILCFHTGFGDRVTREIFATAADEAPMLAQAGGG
ncbi:MAG: LysR family transcriptional regulator [Xanthobacteraceae bacterium]|nr:LysR family transcriptional regulator [Xanthobacteraceae bacterium]